VVTILVDLPIIWEGGLVPHVDPSCAGIIRLAGLTRSADPGNERRHLE